MREFLLRGIRGFGFDVSHCLIHPGLRTVMPRRMGALSEKADMSGAFTVELSAGQEACRPQQRQQRKLEEVLLRAVSKRYWEYLIEAPSKDHSLSKIT